VARPGDDVDLAARVSALAHRHNHPVTALYIVADDSRLAARMRHSGLARRGRDAGGGLGRKLRAAMVAALGA
jgi:hypothetical protein